MRPPARPWVYVAGPYTHPDPIENTHRAIRVGDHLATLGFVPIIPHLSLLWHMVAPHPAKYWYGITAEWLKRCDVVYRLKGASKGGDEEVALADKLGIPVIYEDESGDHYLKLFLEYG
jgi:hypothetical protein